MQVAKHKNSHASVQKNRDTLDFKLTFKLIFSYITYYKKALILALTVALISTAFNITVIIGMADIQSFFSSIVVATTDKLGLTTFLTCSAVIFVCYFFTSFFQWIMNLLVIRLAQGIGFKMRMDLFNKVQILSVKYFDTHESGNVMSVLTNDVYNIVQFISQNLTQIMYGMITMLGMLILMFVISPTLTIIILAILVILLSLVSIIIKRSGPAFVAQQRELGRASGFAEETISGQRIISLYSQENNVAESFKEINTKLVKSAEISQGISGLITPWLNFLQNFIIAILYGIGVTFIFTGVSFYGIDASSVTLWPGISDSIYSGEGGEITVKLASLTSIVLAARNFVQPINQILVMFTQLNQAAAGCKRANEIFVQPSEHKNTETVTINHPLKGKVEIKNLNFSYVEGKPVLKNVNISANPGQTIAIVGPTGSGKTTIINLLTKFYDIEDGEIYIDEYDIKTVTKESIRNQVSIVLQDTYLFDGSIKENIRLAKPDATDEEIIKFAKEADCDDFIMKLENGYDTVLTENAKELSSGQKQLLAIARAMISPSSILILDEATSNIDTRTEKVVQSAMLKLIKNKTSFVIAHRLSTVRNADKIVVLKDGSVLETGNHKELMAKKGFYYNLNLSKTDNLDIDND